MYCRSSERAPALDMHSDGRWCLLKAKKALVEHRDVGSREGESFGTQR